MRFLFAQIKGTELKEQRSKFKITKEDYEKIVPKDIEKEVDTKLTKYKEYRKKKTNSYYSMKNDSESAKIVHYLWETGFSYLRIVELLGLEEVYKNCCNIPEKPKWSKEIRNKTKNNGVSIRNNPFDIQNLLADELKDVNRSKEIKNKTNKFRTILPNNLKLLADVTSSQESMPSVNEISVDKEATETINDEESADNEVSIYLGKGKRSVNDERSEFLHTKKRKISENSSVEQEAHEKN